MARITTTLLGLTLVTALSAAEADAGLFDWFGFTSPMYPPRVAGPVNSGCGPNGCYTCGPTGCAPCTNNWCGTTTRPASPYGYGTSRGVYYPATTYYGGGSVAPCTTGNCPSGVYPAVPTYRPAPTSNLTPVFPGGSSPNPYYGSY